MYLEALTETPILSEKDFSKVMPFDSLHLDKLGLFRPLEMVAFKGSVFHQISIHEDSKGNKIFRISYEGYPSKTPLYVDARFVKPINDYKREKIPMLSRDQLCQMMKDQVGVKYVWGGNSPNGIKAMQDFYPYSFEENSHHRFFEGLDCSGLLYYVTKGQTPRNTEGLKFFGKGLNIKGLTNESIISLLKPLDMVIWKGHVFFILDSKTAIESRVYRGSVYLTDIKERFAKIYQEDGVIAANDPYDLKGFVVRRWYD